MRFMQTNKLTAALAFLQSSSLPMLVQEEIERLIMTGELAVGAASTRANSHCASTPAAARSARP